MTEDLRQLSSFNEGDHTLFYQMAADIAARAGGPAFDLRVHSQHSGCPVPSRSVRRGGYRTACSGEARPLDSETKSRSIQRWRSPSRLPPTDRTGNYSTATARATPPVPASPDCDAYTSTSPPASSSSGNTT